MLTNLNLANLLPMLKSIGPISNDIAALSDGATIDEIDKLLDDAILAGETVASAQKEMLEGMRMILAGITRVANAALAAKANQAPAVKS